MVDRASQRINFMPHVVHVVWGGGRANNRDECGINREGVEESSVTNPVHEIESIFARFRKGSSAAEEEEENDDERSSHRHNSNNFFCIYVTAKS